MSIVAGFVTAGLVAAGTLLFGLEGLFAGGALAAVVVFPVYVWRLSRSVPGAGWPLRPELDLTFVKEAVRLGAVTLAAAAGMQGALLGIRWSLSHAGGAELNGYFQAAWSIGTLYLGMVLSAFGNFIFPRYAAAKSDEELAASIDEASRFVLRTAVPIVLMAIAFRDVVLRGLFNERFDPALPLLGIMFLGDVPKLVAWTQGGALLYRGKAGWFLVNQVVALSLLTVASFVLIPRIGLVGAGWAYLLTYAAHPIVTALTLKGAFRFRLHARRLAWTYGMIVVTAGALWLCDNFSHGRLLVAPVAVLLALRSGVVPALRSVLRRRSDS